MLTKRKLHEIWDIALAAVATTLNAAMGRLDGIGSFMTVKGRRKIFWTDHGVLHCLGLHEYSPGKTRITIDHGIIENDLPRTALGQAWRGNYVSCRKARRRIPGLELTCLDAEAPAYASWAVGWSRSVRSMDPPSLLPLPPLALPPPYEFLEQHSLPAVPEETVSHYYAWSKLAFQLSEQEIPEHEKEIARLRWDMSPGDRAALRRADASGYLVDNRRRSVARANAWWSHCKQERMAYIIVRPKRRRSILLCDSFSKNARFTDVALGMIDARLKSSAAWESCKAGENSISVDADHSFVRSLAKDLVRLERRSELTTVDPKLQ